MDLSIMMQYLYRKKAEKIEQRLAKAEKELTFAGQFDKVVLNDNLEQAESEVERLVRQFIE